MSKIIELKDNDSKDNSNPLEQCGEYTVNFDHLEMNRGDSLGIRSCFLDTRSITEGKIKIDASNKNITLSHYMYITDIFTTPLIANITYEDATGSNIVHPDGKRYILSKVVGANPNRFTLQTFSYPLSALDDDNKKTTHGGFDVNLEYNAPDPQNPAGHIRKSVTLKAIRSAAPVFCSYQGRKNFEIEMQGPTFEDANLVVTNSKDVHRKGGVDYDSIQDFDVTLGECDDGASVQPIMFTYNFTLDEGNYAPTDIAKVITDKLIVAKTVPTGSNSAQFTFTDDEDSVTTIFPTLSPYLTHIEQLKVEHGNYGSIAGQAAQQFVREDGKSIMSINDNVADPNTGFSTNSLFVGCSELSLQFNLDTQKFVFTQIHQPIFATIGGNTVIANQLIVHKDGGGNVTKRSYVGSSGGICFASLASNSASFLLEDLGFSGDLFVAPEKGENATTFTNGGQVLSTSKLVLIDGVNVSSSITGVDTIVDKSKFQVLPPDNAVEMVASINSFNIFAENTTGSVHLKDGYFLIEIDGIPNTKILNNDSPSIQAIVSRYYATADFVIMEDYAGSIPYVHNSDVPLILSSVRVRILDALGQQLNQLGPNNTVFLEYKPADSQ